MNPLMMKLMPYILKSQNIAMDFSSLMLTDEKSVMISVYSDLVQIVPIIIIFTLSGIISKEFKGGYALIPLSRGMNRKDFLYPKFFVYSILIIFSILINILLTLLYSSLIFSYKEISLLAPILGAIDISLLLVFFLSGFIYLDIIFNKSTAISSILTLIFFYGTSIINSFVVEGPIIGNPFSLNYYANAYNVHLSNGHLITILITLAITFVLILLSSLALEKRFY
jgi:ABC-type transport system involved in multi-copper enzyme maturation permease subunit